MGPWKIGQGGGPPKRRSTMKKTVTLALTILLVLGLMSGCANDTPAHNAENAENTDPIARA